MHLKSHRDNFNTILQVYFIVAKLSIYLFYLKLCSLRYVFERQLKECKQLHLD